MSPRKAKTTPKTTRPNTRQSHKLEALEPRLLM